MSKKNLTAEKCELVLRKMVEIINTGNNLTLEEDFGHNTMTVIVENKGHSHVGVPDGSFEQMIDHLHGLLCEGRGLSWVE